METLSGLGIKLGNVSTILQLGIQNISWTSPYMQVLESMPWDSCLQDQVHWAYIVVVRNMIYQMLGMLESLHGIPDETVGNKRQDLAYQLIETILTGLFPR